MQWNLEQLRQFSLAAEKGSFSGAARALGKAQSAVSTSIALLEAELGVDLFDRSGRLPVLTQAGAMLLDEAREVLRQCGQLTARAAALCETDETSVRLALDEGLQYWTMLRVFKAISDEFPHMKISLAMGSSTEVHNWVKNGQVQLAVAFESDAPHGSNVDSSWLGQVDQVIFTSKKHPLGGARLINRRELARHQQILIGFSPQSAGAEKAISPMTWETNSSYMAIDLVLEGFGWVMLPISFAEYEGIPEDLVPLKPEDMALPPLNIQLLSRVDLAPSRFTGWLRSRLEKEFKKGA